MRKRLRILDVRARLIHAIMVVDKLSHCSYEIIAAAFPSRFIHTFSSIASVIVMVIVFLGMRILEDACTEKRQGLPLSLGLWWISSGSRHKNVD
ncbi:MAG: hypothetical protein ACREC0_03235 [Methylocella sp.]